MGQTSGEGAGEGDGQENDVRKIILAVDDS